MTAINLALASRPQIRELLKAGTITPDQALARCDEIIARETVSANKRQAWTNLRAQIVAGGEISIAATYAHMKPAPKAAKPAPTPEAKAAKAKTTFDAAALARAANLCAKDPEVMAAFVQLLSSKR